MSILAIILLIILGLVLLVIEFLVVPGVTIAGIGGILLLAGSIYFSYKSHGPVVGNYTLAGTLIALSITMFFSLRKKTWKRLMLVDEVEGKSFETLIGKIQPGDEGKTLSRLNPIGRVIVKDMNIEGKSTGVFIDPNTTIEVIKVHDNHVIVKPLK